MTSPLKEPGGVTRPSARVRHHREVSRHLDRVRGQLRSVRLLRGALVCVSVFAVLLVVLVATDNALHLRSVTRAVLLAASAVFVAAWSLWWVVLRPFRFLPDEECALVLERARPDLSEHLINTVSFDSTHDRERRSGIEGAIMNIVEDETLGRLSTPSDGPTRNLRSVRRPGVFAAVGLLLLIAYALFFPVHFRNGLARVLLPLGGTPPVTRTLLTVVPGDAELLFGEDLQVTARVAGTLPERAHLDLNGEASLPMAFDGRSFSYTVERPRRDFRYRVTAGDATSALYSVRLRRPPEVRDLTVTVEPPAYTGWSSRVEEHSSGSLEALAGSRLTLDVRSTLPVESGMLRTRTGPDLPLEVVSEDRLRVVLDLEKDVEYGLHLRGADGTVAAAGDVHRKLSARPDAAPTCEVLLPRKDVSVPLGGAAVLPLTLVVKDDVGLADAGVEVARAEDGTSPETAHDWQPVAHFDGFRGATEAVPSVSLEVDEVTRLVTAGSEPEEPGVWAYRAWARDLKGSRSVSRVYLVARVRADRLAEEERRVLQRAEGALQEVLAREKALHRSTRSALGEPPDGLYGARARALGREQEDIRSLALRALGDWSSEGALASAGNARSQLHRVAHDLMPPVAEQLRQSGGVGEEWRRRLLEAASRGERTIIAAIERILGLVSGALGERSLADGASSGGDRPRRLRGVDVKLRELRDALERFAAEQGEVLLRTRALEGIAPEDFTSDEKNAVEELAAIEETWGRHLEEKGTDLSKVAPQDMSVGSLSEEVVELIEEIDLARDYLEGSNVELAVPAEQSGVQLAEEIRTNIERWLSRDRDRLKWVMEEPAGEFDVPLVDLPSELEDIVGDLVDQEDLMTSATEDITSSWLDSMDDGIGWDAMDGPISNMSAKGVTGNLQPNDMEIGGRSGEGRSGKSLGQFVEETAAGKGGRQTPTRSTPDPFESGEVADTGQDPTGGSTGGGKLAGSGAEGLRGQPSPELNRRMGALAAAQKKIRQEAERVAVALRRRRYFHENLERSIELMREMEDVLAARRPYRYEALRRRIASELRAAERTVADQLEHRLEVAPAAPPDLREELLNASGEEMPEQFRDVLEDYYRALAAPPPTEARGADG